MPLQLAVEFFAAGARTGRDFLDNIMGILCLNEEPPSNGFLLIGSYTSKAGEEANFKALVESLAKDSDFARDAAVTTMGLKDDTVFFAMIFESKAAMESYSRTQKATFVCSICSISSWPTIHLRVKRNTVCFHRKFTSTS